MFKCTICGATKTHYRLYGYQCHNRSHGEMERENTMRALQSHLPDVGCKTCAAVNTNGARYCARCGKSLKDAPTIVSDDETFDDIPF